MPELEQFVYILRVVRPGMLTEGFTEAEQSSRDRHVAYVSALADAGVVLLAGRTQVNDERSMGLVILQAESDEAAREYMHNDPAVAEGIMTAEFFPYKVAFWGSSVASLASPRPRAD